MTPESFLNNRVTLWPGDCLDALARMEEGSVDSVVTDPPYHLTSIVKRFGADDAAPVIPGKTGAYARASAGFMGKKWDGGDIAFRPEVWAAVFRVLKPGGHLVAFSGTRTYHRMVCAIEDAGFEVRDQIGWAFGSGFPKSHDVSKGIDRAAGAEREVSGRYVRPDGSAPRDNVIAPKCSGLDYNGGKPGGDGNDKWITAPATDAARQWEGWGTALKPAWEPIVLARKPLSEGTIAANVLRHGTGALNIDGCRIPGEKPQVTQGINSNATSFNVAKERRISGDPNEGRWPANIITDGSEEVVAAFPETQSGLLATHHSRGNKTGSIYGKFADNEQDQDFGGDRGSAARFFYSAKADSDDRLGSKHPTVKPLDLMQYLVRLVTPPGGTVLDLFAGTGTTGEAAWREGMNAVLIEREEEYQQDIRRRMKLALGGPEERKRESIKASGKAPGHDDLPLFAEPPYDPMDDFAKSLELGYSTIRERKANGGPGWTPGGGK